MYEQILLPTDGSEAAEGAIEQAIDITERYDAALHILYVVDVTATTLNIRGSDTSLDQIEEEGQEVIEDSIQKTEQSEIGTVTGSVIEGIPDEAILEYADEHDIDLIVMGTQGRTGLDRYIIGSVTEKVVRHANPSVLTVRMTAST